MPHNDKQQGFTLMEVLVATVIMAVIGAALLTTLSTVTRSYGTMQERSERLRELQRVFVAGWYDFSQAAPVAVLTPPYADPLTLDSASLSVIRGGWKNPLDESRSALQTVRYAQEEESGRLLRHYAPLAGGEGGTQLLAGAVEFEARIMDEKGQFHAIWPVKNHEAEARLIALKPQIAPYENMEIHIPLVSLPMKHATREGAPEEYAPHVTDRP